MYSGYEKIIYVDEAEVAQVEEVLGISLNRGECYTVDLSEASTLIDEGIIYEDIYNQVDAGAFRYTIVFE